MVQRSLLIDTSAPHDILDELLSVEFPNYIIIKKPAIYFSESARKEVKLKAYFFQLRHVFRSAVELIKNSRRSYIFREYDNFALLYMLMPLKLDLAFVVNHNLNSAIGSIVTRIMTLRYTIVFVDPGLETIDKFPFLYSIFSEDSIEATRLKKWNGKSVLLICGSKRDQRNFSHGQLEKLKQDLDVMGFEILAVGNNIPGGCYLPSDKFLNEVKKSLVICTSAYRGYRNSGTLWFLKVYAPVIFVNKTDCGNRQLIGHPDWRAYGSINQLIELLLGRLNNRHT